MIWVSKVEKINCDANDDTDNFSSSYTNEETCFTFPLLREKTFITTRQNN